jgi:hypothetical protein
MAGKKWGGGGWFFVIFRPYFLHAQAMKSTPIYKGWKKGNLVYTGENFWPLIRLGRISTIDSK